MRAAQLNNNIVTNMIEVDSLDILPNLIDGTGGNIGDTWDGERFTRPTVDPAVIKAEMWERIKAERDRRTQTGGYPATGKWFHSDTFSRTQILGLVMMGANIPAGLMWKTMDGTFIAMDSAAANQVFAAAAMQDTATFQAAETHKEAMEASADPASYDFSTGWPAVFGE